MKKLHLHRPRFNTILLLLILAGMSLILYPSFSDWWNDMHQSRAVASYLEAVGDKSADENKQILDNASLYNVDLSLRMLQETSSKYFLNDEETELYNNTLDITGTGIMGYIKIPKINVELPIYHGTDDAVLQIAIGHIPWSSLPVGGESTHCVISGHRGLPSAKLFTDIDELVPGDTFLLNTLDMTLTYEVDQIRTVLPDELNDLAIIEGEDLCTLVTCTPYGINTHRMLVRGHRVANAMGEIRVTADAMQVDRNSVAFVLGIAIVVLLLLFFLGPGRNIGKAE